MPPSGPGRLGDPTMSVATDPRSNAKMMAALKRMNIHEPSYLAPQLPPEASLEEKRAFALQSEAALEGLLSSLDYNVPHATQNIKVTRSEEYASLDNSESVRILVFRPAGSETQLLPALMYMHGGGMIMLSTDNPIHVTWAEALARLGLVVLVIDFRNSLCPTGLNPFPDGLNDCVTAIKWAYAHRQRLGISKIVLQGESGGANLALACTLRAKREGWVDYIQGVSAQCPYISGAYSMSEEWRLQHLPSLVECDGYLINNNTSALNARLYDPEGRHDRDPLAWPYWASEEDVSGLPPHLVVANELDPLRDEGLAYYAKLSRAGVRVVGRINAGLVHGADMFLRSDLPDVFMSGILEIKSFVDHIA